MNVSKIGINCIGCGACVERCPINAITLVRDPMGFNKAAVFLDKCIDCSQCIKVCPTLNRNDTKIKRTYYYGWNKNENIRLHSTSGGAFSAIANSLITSDAVVFGARYDNHYQQVVMANTEECTLEDLRGTKYCQAHPNHLFEKIATILPKRKVMVVGTPCMISACRNFFGNVENLYLVDFICGGVVSASILADYVMYMEKKYRSKVIHMDMRDKSISWDKPHMRIEFANKKKYIRDYRYDPYLFYYYTPYFKSELCLHCPFVEHRESDITIGDFWGYRKENIANDGKGISLLCVNSCRGEDVIREIKDKMHLFPLEDEQVSYAFKQKNFSKQSIARRERYMKDLNVTFFMSFAKQHEFQLGTLGAYFQKVFRKIKFIK